MYNTSQNYKDKVLADSTQHELNIYIDGNKVDSNHIIDFKQTIELFNNNEFCLGCTPEKDIEFEIDKRDLPEIYNEIYVETGIKYHEDVIKEGEDITTNEEEEIPLNLEIYGNCKQETKSTENEDEYNSPSFNYPSEIKTVGNNVNLFDKTDITENISISISNGKTYKDDNSFATNFIKIKGIEEVFCNALSSNTSLWGATYDEDKNYIKGFMNTSGLLDQTILSDATYIRLGILKKYLDTTKIEQGSKATSYSSYGQGCISLIIENEDKTQSQTFTIPTQKPMRAIEDYKDTFIKKNGKWYEIHYVGKFKLNSNVTFNKYDSPNNNAYCTKISNFTNQEPIYPQNNSSVAQILCTHGLKTYANDIAFNKASKVGFTFESTKEVWIGFGTSGPSTIEEFKAWLIEQENANTPVEIYYALKTPNDIECTEEQNRILDELENAITYKGTTYIYSTDNVKPYMRTTCGSEIVPIGYFTIQSVEDDEFKVKIKATDYMKKFADNNYDGSNLTYPATMLEVLEDICTKIGVELSTTSFLNSDKEIAVYDNEITSRTYLGYIAEQAGGFAVIGRDGKVHIKTFGENITDFDINLFGDFKWGDKFKVGKVSYEDGIQDYKFEDEIADTVYIDQNNMYIVDREQVENIYEQIKDFEVYTFEGETIIDPAYDVGDILVIDSKKVLYQGGIEYAGKFKANIKSTIQAKTEQESMQTKQSNSNKIKRVQSEINQIDGKITQLVQETSEHEEKITQAQQDINSFTQKVATKDELTEKVNELKHTIEGIALETKKTGGENIFYYSKEYWEGEKENSSPVLEEITNTNIKQNTISSMGYILNNGKSIQSKVVKNGYYTISFKYLKLIDLANGSITINNISYKLDADSLNQWYEQVILLEVTTNSIIIEINTDTNNSYWFSDLMVAVGTEQKVWSQNANETLTDNVKIGKGIQVESSSTNTYTRIDADGNRTYNKTTDERVAEMTDKGVYANELEVKGQAKINSLLIQEIDGQVWITGIGG